MWVSCLISLSASWVPGIFGGRLCSDQSFLSLCHRRRVAGLSMLYKVNSIFYHCLQRASICFYNIELVSVELRPQLIHWSLKYEGEELPNLVGLSCRLRFECGMTFPTQCLTPERWMGSTEQSTVGCLPELCILQFSVAQVLVGL